MKLKDSELKSILAEVETEIASLLKSEGEALKKAKEDEKEEPVEAPAAESAPAEASAPAPEMSAPPAEASAPAPEMSAPPAEASAPPAAAPVDPAMDMDGDHDAGPVDPEALKAEYCKLDPEALKAHYMAAKAALFELMGAAGAAGPEASAPVPPEASAPAMAPPAMKAEVPASMKKVPANGGLKEQAPAVPDAIKKSESDEKINDLEKQVELMAKALEIAIGTPVRKAITSVAHLPKTENLETKVLSKEEVKTKIKSAMSSGKLSKSQKDQLFSYTLGNLNFDSVKDLLEVK